MFTAMILACGMGTDIEGLYTFHCRTFTSELVHDSVDKCTEELSLATILIEVNKWEVAKYDCYDWSNKSNV